MHTKNKQNVYSQLFYVWVNPYVEWCLILCVNVNGLEFFRSAKHISMWPIKLFLEEISKKLMGIFIQVAEGFSRTSK